MRLSKLIGEIGAKYDPLLPASSQAHRLLHRAGAEFKQWVPSGYLVKGRGEPAMIAIFNPDETTTTGRGLYVAYLFAADKSTVTITLNQGMDEMAEHLGRAGARKVLAQQAATIRAALRPADIADLDLTFDLGTTQESSVDYEHANIVSRTYSLDNLPGESEMVADLQGFVRLYTLATEAREVARRHGRHELITPAPRPSPKIDTKITNKVPAVTTPDPKPPVVPSPKVPAQPSAKVSAEPSAKLPAQPSAKVSAEPSAKLPAQPSAKVPAQPSAKVSAEPSAKLSAQPSAKVPDAPEAKVPAQPSGKPPSEAEAEPVAAGVDVPALTSETANPLDELISDTKAGKNRSLAGTLTRRGILAALIVAPIAYAAPRAAASKNQTVVTKTPLREKTSPVFTIDVSQHDWKRRGGNLDWVGIRRAGLAGMCARATYGDPSGYQWPTHYFGSFARGAKEAGMGLRGGYHNLVRGDQPSINRQVDWLRRELDKHDANWAMLDIERYSELIKADMWPTWEDVRRFDDRWAAVEERVLVGYLPPWNWSKHLGQPDLRDFRGPLIASNYPREANEDFKELYEQIGGNDGRGWASYGNRVPEGWQYSSRAKVPGAAYICDVNAWRITFEELTKLLTGPLQEQEIA